MCLLMIFSIALRKKEVTLTDQCDFCNRVGLGTAFVYVHTEYFTPTFFSFSKYKPRQSSFCNMIEISYSFPEVLGKLSSGDLQ